MKDLYQDADKKDSYIKAAQKEIEQKLGKENITCILNNEYNRILK